MDKYFGCARIRGREARAARRRRISSGGFKTEAMLALVLRELLVRHSGARSRNITCQLSMKEVKTCLLYTSDAADDTPCVDL
eukprot:336459-Amphidinium_carterae.1